MMSLLQKILYKNPVCPRVKTVVILCLSAATDYIVCTQIATWLLMAISTYACVLCGFL